MADGSDARAAPRLNRMVADRLREAAEVLEQQQANPFRVAAYRRAADTVDGLDGEVGALVEREGLDGLVALPGIGRGIARAIYELVATGRWAQLDRLRGALDPEHLFQTLPGVGPTLARRIHDRLGLDTLEGLEQAAHDGRLAQVDGIGHRRAASLRASLDAILSRARWHRPRPGGHACPLQGLLAVDAEYREKAEAGDLPTVAPRRFNPEGEAWLPILHASRGGWHFTALYSNTARAHELGRTRDWVVVYCYDEGEHQEAQYTVVTETRGPLMGRRVVRGREAECRRHYASSAAGGESV